MPACGTTWVTSARTAWLRLAGGPAERRALAAADVVIALTPAAAGRLAGEGIPDSRIGVIPPGYDPDLFAAGAPDPFPDLGRPRVGYIGRIAPQKDVGTLISAFGRLTGPACLLIVGDGPGRRAAEAQARRLAGPVRFTGFAPHARIPAVLQHIDLLVLATRYEELPSVLIEAMAAGVPVIASRVGGIPPWSTMTSTACSCRPATRPPSPRPFPAFSPNRSPPPGWPLPPGRPRSGTPGPRWHARSPRSTCR
jgi:glycosyltransferase involved in cell wall biosynthesis